MKMFNRKPEKRALEFDELNGDILIDYKGTLIQVANFTRKPVIVYKMHEGHKVAEAISIDELKDTIELIEAAMLLEENDILSGAFSLDSDTHHLKLDYHNLTMMGEEFNKKVRRIKRKLGVRVDEK